MLDILTPLQNNFLLDVEVDDPTQLDPLEADAFEQGEWVYRTNTGKYARLGLTSLRGAVQIFSQRGDVCTQTLGKTAVFMLQEYTADTDMFEDGGAGFSEGDALTVLQITVDGVTRSGLTQASSGDLVYGYVEKAPGDNEGKLRFTKQIYGREP